MYADWHEMEQSEVFNDMQNLNSILYELLSLQ
jgi:hypothetical protein